MTFRIVFPNFLLFAYIAGVDSMLKFSYWLTKWDLTVLLAWAKWRKTQVAFACFVRLSSLMAVGTLSLLRRERGSLTTEVSFWNGAFAESQKYCDNCLWFFFFRERVQRWNQLGRGYNGKSFRILVVGVCVMGKDDNGFVLALYVFVFWARTGCVITNCGSDASGRLVVAAWSVPLVQRHVSQFQAFFLFVLSLTCFCSS